MTIREYLKSISSESKIDVLLKIYEEIKDDNSIPNLDILKSVDKSFDELFFKVVDKAHVLNRLINTSIELIIEDIDTIDIGFLNRKIPPHIKKQNKI